MTKKTNPAIFYILKSLVDRQVPELRQQVHNGAVASQNISVLKDQVASLAQYAATNRHDREAVQDAETDMDACEREISYLTEQVNQAQNAKNQLNDARKFNTLFEKEIVMPAVKAHEINELNAQYKRLDREVGDIECMYYTQRNYVEDIQAEPESPERAVLANYYEKLNKKREELNRLAQYIRVLQR